MSAFETNGKVSEDSLKELLLDSLGASRPEVLSPAQFGVDTSIIDLGGGQGLAISSDPLSLIPSLGMEVSAWLSVHLIINDMATTGFCPQYAQFVLNLPTSLSKEDFAVYWHHIHHLCEKHQIAITGGHTGQIPGQESTISGGGTMFLQAPLNELISSKGGQAGDVIIATKSTGLSSTSLLAMVFPETVANKCGKNNQQNASDNFWKLSVLPEALIVNNLETPQGVHAMHDVTEGGILGALYEMARASNCGFDVNLDTIPVQEEVKLVADLFQIDPLQSIGAGSMLIAIQKGCESSYIKELQTQGIQASIIGTLTDNHTYLCQNENGTYSSYEHSGVDPYWSAFFKAYNQGWK